MMITNRNWCYIEPRTLTEVMEQLEQINHAAMAYEKATGVKAESIPIPPRIFYAWKNIIARAVETEE